MKNLNRSGQAAIFVVLAVPLFFGLVGLVFDMGMVYVAEMNLSDSTQAAALAGAEAMALPGATTATVTTAVKDFSSASGGANTSKLYSGASIATGYPAMSCLTTVSTSMNVSCYGPSSTNAISVKQTATFSTYFLRMFGATTFELSSMATAAMRGSAAAPYNVAIVVDTTRSMNDLDSDSNCNNTRISCALAGISVLLGTLSPCKPGLSSCGTASSGNVPNSVDRVSLFVFPPVTTGTVANDYNCSGNSITTASYTNPLPATSTYQVVGFSSDYRSSDSASSLSTSSNLIAAVQGTSGTPCLQVKGGYGTYYAQAIYQAQAALVSEQASFPGSQNVMIILSDGDATATAAAMPGSSATSGTYTSSVQECAQAVTAAQAAANAKTRVYTVAYGAEASGCLTDTSGITPCQTMEQMASASAYFYSDYTATGGTSTCVSASQPTSSLNQIFKSIGADLTVSRLIPNNTQ